MTPGPEHRCKKCGKPIPERRVRNSKGGAPTFCSDRHQVAYRVARFRSKTPKNRQDLLHMRNLIAHGMIAEKLLQDPQLIEDAIGTVSDWASTHGDLPALREWRKVLETRDFRLIVAHMLAVDEKGMRMRSSSPFAGLLTEDERALAYSPRSK